MPFLTCVYPNIWVLIPAALTLLFTFISVLLHQNLGHVPCLRLKT
jgi:hypothetical protein